MDETIEATRMIRGERRLEDEGLVRGQRAAQVITEESFEEANGVDEGHQHGRDVGVGEGEGRASGVGARRGVVGVGGAVASGIGRG